jgi:hypothetical protein
MKLLILLFIFSCATSKNHKTDFWWILENYTPSWDSEKIVSILGKPNEILPINGENNWIYKRSRTEYQSWAIGMSKDNKVTGLAYLPENQLYIMDVENRWKTKKCEHKKETKLTAGHNYKTIRSFICDAGKTEVYYNRYNEVEGTYLK